jgi:hypothetical protein
MIDNTKKSKDVESAQFCSEKIYTHSNLGVYSILNKSDLLIPLGAGILQVFIGLTMVGVSILGLVNPLWLSAVLSLAGSISAMTGVFLLYHIFSSKGSFESLINQAIRRVITSQN